MTRAGPRRSGRQACTAAEGLPGTDRGRRVVSGLTRQCHTRQGFSTCQRMFTSREHGRGGGGGQSYASPVEGVSDEPCSPHERLEKGVLLLHMVGVGLGAWSGGVAHDAQRQLSRHVGRQVDRAELVYLLLDPEECIEIPSISDGYRKEHRKSPLLQREYGKDLQLMTPGDTRADECTIVLISSTRFGYVHRRHDVPCITILITHHCTLPISLLVHTRYSPPSSQPL